MVLIKYIVFVSIDKPEWWSRWHSGSTSDVYFSDFFNTKDDANNFINQVKYDYPDNNLIDGKCDHEYFIECVVLNYDQNDIKGFEILCKMMRAYSSYNNRRILT